MQLDMLGKYFKRDLACVDLWKLLAFGLLPPNPRRGLHPTDGG
jgi:hypothetical protein